jgi:hypothetical protein
MAHLAIRFILELAALVGAGVVGATAGAPPFGLAGAVAAVAAFAVVWGLWIAPRARFALAPTLRLLIGTLLMLAVAVGLVLVAQPTAGEVLIAAILANAVLLLVTGNVDPAQAAAIGRGGARPR